MPAKRAPATSGSQYHLYLLGGFRLERDGEPISLNRSKAIALLAYLALLPQEHRREKVAADLWLDSTDADARLSLRVTLNSLRNEISPDLVLADRETLQLNPAFPLWVDVRVLQNARLDIATESIENLKSKIENYRDLLPELYDEWLIPERERLRQTFLDLALAAVEQARGASDYATAIELAQHILRIDRANETAHQHLIFCYIASGNRAAALKQFQDCERNLREELAAEPSPETRALLKHITQETRPKSAAAALTNLPKPLTSFIGREREIQELCDLLRSNRQSELSPVHPLTRSPLHLLTLIGAGGSGKTRLAIQVAHTLLDEYEHGVWFVDLAPLADETLVPQTVAKALGLQETASENITDGLVNFLRRRHLLLILDNCEHLLNACAALAVRLLTECERLQILATSREALNIGGELVWHVPTLGVPTTDDGRQTVDNQQSNAVRRPSVAVLDFPSVRLFVDRAQSAKPDFKLTAQNIQGIIEICRRLDGLPLAIELAAARVKLLSPHEIAARLDQRFDVLSGGSRGVLPRQQTLRALLDWSFDLLSQAERILFRRLAVFSGGWTLQAAQEICADETLPKQNILALLAGLVDKSLVLVETTDETTRYNYLETIREYAREKLNQANETESCQLRHLDYFVAFAEHAEPELYQRDQTEWLNRLEQDHDNFRSALRRTFENNAQDRAIQLAGALGYFWYLRGYPRESDEWLTRVLHLKNSSTPLSHLARGLSAAGTAAWMMGDSARAERLHREALALYQELGDKWRIVFCLSNIALQVWDQGQLANAIELVATGQRLVQEYKDPYLVWLTSLTMGVLQLAENHLAEAEELFEMALDASNAHGSAFTQAYSLMDLAEVRTRRGLLSEGRKWGELAYQLVETHSSYLTVCEKG